MKLLFMASLFVSSLASAQSITRTCYYNMYSGFAACREVVSNQCRVFEECVSRVGRCQVDTSSRDENGVGGIHDGFNNASAFVIVRQKVNCINGYNQTGQYRQINVMVQAGSFAGCLQEQRQVLAEIPRCRN